MFHKLKKIRKRLKENGWVATARYAFEDVLKRLSLDYRLSPESFSEYSKGRFALVLASDSARTVADKLLTLVGNMLVRRGGDGMPALSSLALYQVDLPRLSPTSIVYSFGVSRNITFDVALAEKVGCHIYLFDPTPPAVEFMREIFHPSLTFAPVGLWIENGARRFYVDRNTENVRNLSILNIFHTDTFVECECKTLEAIMKDNGHERIHLLKLDIEGAALSVLEDMLEGSLRPLQITGELEMPRLTYGAHLSDIAGFLKRKYRFLKNLEKAGYRILTYGKAEFTALYKASS
jgi:FkbM family methyltransferase